VAGRAGRVLARHAAGIDGSRIRRTALPPAPIQERLLPSPTADAGAVMAAIRSEAERTGRELRSRGVFATTLTLRLRFADGRLDSRTTRLSEPTALDDALLEAAHALLARMAPADRALRAAAISCAGLLAPDSAPALFPVNHRRRVR
jgi:DNA polymerase IV